MSWKLKEKLQSILGQEEGVKIKDWGGKTSVALVYPNTYAVGMGNLAVHTLYKLFNDRDDMVCERAFLPSKVDETLHARTGTPVLSIESQRPLSDFDIIAFTISFENDYLNILPILELSRIPYLRGGRSDAMPFLIAGGAAPSLNPLPLSGIFDVICLGEAEDFVNDLLPLLAERIPKDGAIDALAKIDGIFVPASPPPCENWPINASKHESFDSIQCERKHIRNLDDWKTQTVIHSKNAEFGDMHLIEMERGCPYCCRFCATPVLYTPPRIRSPQSILAMVEDGLPLRKKFGLIGANILNHPNFIEIAEAIHKKNAVFSPSSVRADAVDEVRAGLLARSRHQSVALGVEAGSERLRRSAGKAISDKTVVDAVISLARAGIPKIRPYFMVGLPEETDEDIRSIAELSRSIREALREYAPRRKRQTGVELTISPFVPKPGTPWENMEFAGEESIKRRIRLLKGFLSNEEGIPAHFTAPLSAAIEATLSRGRPEVLEFLEEANRLGNARQAIRAWTKGH